MKPTSITWYEEQRKLGLCIKWAVDGISVVHCFKANSLRATKQTTCADVLHAKCGDQKMLPPGAVVQLVERRPSVREIERSVPGRVKSLNFKIDPCCFPALCLVWI